MQIFHFLLKTLDNPFNPGQRTLECCQAGSIDGTGSGESNFLSAEGWTNSLTAPERPGDPVASATQFFNQNLQASIRS